MFTGKMLPTEFQPLTFFMAFLHFPLFPFPPPQLFAAGAHAHMANVGPANRPAEKRAWYQAPCLRRMVAGASLGTITGAAFGVFDGFRAGSIKFDATGFRALSESAGTRAVVAGAAAGCTAGFAGFLAGYHGVKCVLERSSPAEQGGWDYGPWGNTAGAAAVWLAPFLRLRAMRRNLVAVALVVGVDLYHELEYLEKHGADR